MIHMIEGGWESWRMKNGASNFLLKRLNDVNVLLKVAGEPAPIRHTLEAVQKIAEPLEVE